MGLTDLDVAVMPHPLGGISNDEVRGRVDAVRPAVLEWLKSPHVASALDVGESDA